MLGTSDGSSVLSDDRVMRYHRLLGDGEHLNSLSIKDINQVELIVALK